MFTSEKPWMALLFAIIVFALFAASWAIYQVSTHSGTPDYCYIATELNQVNLKSHRPWSIDRVIATMPMMQPIEGSTAALLKAASDIGCPVK